MDEVIDLIFPFLKLIKILGVVADSFSSNFSIVFVSFQGIVICFLFQITT